MEYTVTYEGGATATIEYDEVGLRRLPAIDELKELARQARPGALCHSCASNYPYVDEAGDILTITDTAGTIVVKNRSAQEIVVGIRAKRDKENAELIESLRRDLRHLSQERDNLRDMLSRRDKAIEEHRAEILNLIQERDNLRDMLSRKRDKPDTEVSRLLVAERDRFRAQADRLRAELDMSRPEADMLRMERDALRDMSVGAVDHLRDNPPNVEAALILLAP